MQKNPIQDIKLSMQDKVCFICGENNPQLIENHHIFGRNYSPVIIPLCKNCHFLQTREQNKISPKKRSKNASENELEQFMLVSVGALFKLMGETLIELGGGDLINGEQNGLL